MVCGMKNRMVKRGRSNKEVNDHGNYIGDDSNSNGIIIVLFILKLIILLLLLFLVLLLWLLMIRADDKWEYNCKKNIQINPR